MPVDTLSETWRETKAKAETLLARASATVLSKDCTEREADFQRGRIAALKELLDLGETPGSKPAPTIQGLGAGY